MAGPFGFRPHRLLTLQSHSLANFPVRRSLRKCCGHGMGGSCKLILEERQEYSSWRAQSSNGRTTSAKVALLAQEQAQTDGRDKRKRRHHRVAEHLQQLGKVHFGCRSPRARHLPIRALHVTYRDTRNGRNYCVVRRQLRLLVMPDCMEHAALFALK